MKFKYLLQLVSVSLLLYSCGNKQKQDLPDVKPYKPGGYYGASSTQYACPNCGLIISQSDITHNCRQKRSAQGDYSNSSGNQYGAGYEQGQKDVRNGLSPNPSGYGGNGQFEKGYEDGYNE